MTEQWRDLGRGTGKRPDGVLDDDVVRWRYTGQTEWSKSTAEIMSWRDQCEYQLLVRTPADSENGYYEVEQYEVGGSGATEWIDEDDYDDSKSGGLTEGRRWVTLRAPAEPSDVLREALQGVMPYVLSEYLQCNGDKCRHLTCASCFGEDCATAHNEKAVLAVSKAIAALAATEPKGTGK